MPHQGVKKEQGMGKRRRRNRLASFKAKLAYAALAGRKILDELAEHYEMPSNQIKT